jgi:hypothetical protein
MDSKLVEINWAMFEMVSTLGQGSYGDVYKVKCLKSTSLNGKERYLLTEKSSKKVKNELQQKGGALMPNSSRSLLEG